MPTWTQPFCLSSSCMQPSKPQCMALTPGVGAPGALVDLLVQRAGAPVHDVNRNPNPTLPLTLTPSVGAPGALVDLLVQRAGAPVHGAQEEPEVHRRRQPPLQHLARPLRIAHCS